MADLKLFGKNEKQLDTLMNIVRIYRSLQKACLLGLAKVRIYMRGISKVAGGGLILS